MENLWVLFYRSTIAINFFSNDGEVADRYHLQVKCQVIVYWQLLFKLITVSNFHCIPTSIISIRKS